MDIVEYSDKIVIEANLPGVTNRDVQLSIHQDELIIETNKTSKAQANQEAEKGQWIQKQRPSLNAKTVLKLGQKVNIDQILADLKDGVLTIEIPKEPIPQ
jgi:HSP20 family protein